MQTRSQRPPRPPVGMLPRRVAAASTRVGLWGVRWIRVVWCSERKVGHTPPRISIDPESHLNLNDLRFSLGSIRPTPSPRPAPTQRLHPRSTHVGEWESTLGQAARGATAEAAWIATWGAVYRLTLTPRPRRSHPNTRRWGPAGGGSGSLVGGGNSLKQGTTARVEPPCGMCCVWGLEISRHRISGHSFVIVG